MDEYIKRKEAEKRLSQRAEIANSAYIDQTPNQIMMLAQNVVHLIPVADVEPVRHGHWIKGTGENGVTTSLFCSVCHYENGHWYEWNYCPNCGAKADGSGDHAEKV